MEKSKQSFCSRIMLNSVLESWAKMSDDIAKTAIIALPGPIFYHKEVSTIIYSVLGLLIVAISMLVIGVALRQTIANREEK
ncbi:hypothetical protein HW40_12205 [Mannheimia haemolytica]|uniref:hypothetical protein n=1 Tax=Mannheimia haemolytica TaxID=75985 RepID=UPI0005C884FE|nr:hypothetical protein [Mannheimia haemolytica]KIX27738.1 hypothetical protein HW40_12205 [Mannheimia haemolytica]UQX70852.1 hypothetical protein M3705_05200 [Mannheimia haemolytica]